MKCYISHCYLYLAIDLGHTLNNCTINLSGQSSHSLGVYNKQLVYNDGYLQLNYTGGDECPNHAGTKESTLIRFYCDERVVGTSPKLVAGQNPCIHEFHWNTTFACPINSLVDCVYVDVVNGKRYDLSSLSKTTGNWLATVTNPTNKNWLFQINVCRAVNNVDGCSKTSGICLTIKTPSKNR